MQTHLLPIHALKEDILSALQSGSNSVITSPTGSGKTTQVPQFALEYVQTSGKAVIVVELRRVACRASARRICEERGWTLGREVGYITRFDRQVSEVTRLIFMTDGMLLRLLQQSADLPSAQVVIFDEFHERRMLSDLALALLVRAQRARTSLRLMVMSATLHELSRVQQFLDARVFTSSGLEHPVTIDYVDKRPHERNMGDVVVQQILAFHHSDRLGDILVFLPGKGEIDGVMRYLERNRQQQLTVLPLHGDLTPIEQDRVFMHVDGRKVILATNVAETSLTIPGVSMVIDTGLERISTYVDSAGVNVLSLEMISAASAVQRAGRAGREGAGYCLRLWTHEQHKHLHQRAVPEIQRQDVSMVVLILKAAGIDDVQQFQFLEAPRTEQLVLAERTLHYLGALDADGRLTHIGWDMTHYPLSPRLARMMVEAQRNGCVADVSTIAAVLSGKNVFLKTGRKGKIAHAALRAHAGSDFNGLLHVMHEFLRHRMDWRWCQNDALNHTALLEAVYVRARLLQIASQRDPVSSRGPVGENGFVRSVLSGLVDRVAHRQQVSQLFQLANGSYAHVSDHQTCSSDYVAVGHLFVPRTTQHQGSIRMSMVLPITLDMLRQVAPHLFRVRQHLREYFPTTGFARVSQCEHYLELMIGQPQDLIVDKKTALAIQQRTNRLAQQLGLKRVCIERADDRSTTLICRTVDAIVSSSCHTPGEYWAVVTREKEHVVVTPQWQIFDIPSAESNISRTIASTNRLVASLLKDPSI